MKALEQTAQTPWIRRIGFPLVLVLLTVIVYSGTLGDGAIGDGLDWVEASWSHPLDQLNPSAALTASADAPAYWARYHEIDRRLRELGGELRIYRPPLPQLLRVVEATLFGGWIPGYRLVELALHILALLLLLRLLRRLNAKPVLAKGLVLVAAVHPVLSHGVTMLSGLPFLLAGVFGLMAALCALSAAEGRAPRFMPPVWLALALLSDATALAVPALLAGYGLWAGKPSEDDDSEAVPEHGRRTLIDLLWVSGVFLFLRAFLPLVSGPHGLEGWYALEYTKGLTALFAMPLVHTLFYWLALTPPNAPLPLPFSGFFAGIIVPAFFAMAFWRTFKAKSRLAAAGLSAYAMAALVAQGSPIQPEAAWVPLIGLVLISADLLEVLIQPGRARVLRFLGLMVLVLYLLPAGTYLHATNRTILGSVTRTGDNLAELLAPQVKSLPPQARVYLFGVWGASSLLDKRLRLAAGRPDLQVRLLSFNPSHVPLGLPLPEDRLTAALTEWLAPYRDEVPHLLSAPGGNRLRLEIPYGSLLVSLADFTPSGWFAAIPAGRRLDAPGVAVRVDLPINSETRGITYEIPHTLTDPNAAFFIWRQNGWERLDMGVLASQGRRKGEKR